MHLHPLRCGRLWAVAALALAASAVGATQASAHAIVSPAVTKAGVLQFYTLSVPTEKEGAKTTTIELDVPKGFAIDSFAPALGWTRKVQAQGSGEQAVVQRVIWTGGDTPTGEDSVFGFNATATSAQIYRFTVQQTYSDGAVVDWSGSEGSDTPAPTIEAVTKFSSGSSNTIGVIALIVAVVALLLVIVSLAGGRRDLT
jgi:uncharacterized protein YcnI